MLGSKRTLRLARILTASTLHVVLSGARLALEAGLAGADRGLLAVGYLQLVEDVGDVVGDRLETRGQQPGSSSPRADTSSDRESRRVLYALRIKG